MNSRSILTLFGSVAFGLALFIGWSQHAGAAPPNFVVIIADDMSWDDCGAYGHPSIRTPNIDRLAEEGMRFDRAFLTISSCSPSRASIITGRYPHRTDAEELHWPLPGEQTTFTEQLRGAGYWCGAAGKWHLGDEVKDRFDTILAADTSGFQLPSGKAAETGKFVETTAGDERSGCADWVPLLRERPRDKPFFAWLAALDPHRPYDRELVADQYQASDVRLPPYHPDHEEVRKDYLDYYAEITRLDRFVGNVIDELKQQGVADNTFVLFLSDNGRPFPRDKTTLYDSGIRTPFLVRFPKMVKPGAVCSTLVSSIDIAPTVLELAQVAIPASVDGVSFVRQLEKPESVSRKYAFAEKNWHDFEDHVRAVRDVRFKYIRNYYDDLPNTPPADAVRSPTFVYMKARHEQGKLAEPFQACFQAPRPSEELYDTWADPHEVRNLVLIPEFSEQLAEMRQALRDWETQTGDAPPELRTADEFDRVTGKPTAARRRPRWSKKKMVTAGLVAP